MKKGIIKFVQYVKNCQILNQQYESPNTYNVRLWDMFRKVFVAGVGMFGGNKLQWEDFVNTMIKV